MQDAPNRATHFRLRVGHAHAEPRPHRHVVREPRDLAGAGRAGDVGPGAEHPRPRDDPFLDGIPQLHVEEGSIGADVPDGGEPGEEGRVGVGHAQQHLPCLRVLHCRDTGELDASDQVGVAVDQAGGHRVLAQVEDLGARRQVTLVGPDALHAFAPDEHDSIGQHLTAHDVHQAATANDGQCV